jgi:hypothetical protein
MPVPPPTLPAPSAPADAPPIGSAARARAARSERRGATRAPGDPGAGSAPAMLNLPDAVDVARLARQSHPLSLSILMATTPADRMRPNDRAQLDGLLRDAVRRLADDQEVFGHPAQDVEAVRSGIAACVSAAIASPTDRGLAILVSPRGSHLHHLRVSPRDRVVLDPTFATRDLVRSASEDPPFLMLVVDARAARLFHYGQRYSRPLLAHDFPVVREDEPDRGTGRGERGRAARERTRSFLRTVDERLAARVERESHSGSALPVVLISSERMASEYLSVSRSRRISAVVRTGRLNVPVGELEQMARSALAGHVTDRAAAALDTVRARLAHGRAVAGLTAAWEALHHAEPDVLVVEASHAPAMRLSGTGLEFAPDSEEPGVLDDAVDELIEAALARGAEVVTVPDGALAREGRVVLAFTGRVPAMAG